jgi:hypothetical protein
LEYSGGGDEYQGRTGCLTECEMDTAGGGCLVAVAGELYPGSEGMAGMESRTADLAASACFCSSARVGTAGRLAGAELNREEEKGDRREVTNQVAMVDVSERRIPEAGLILSVRSDRKCTDGCRW